jgi:hypothetical protein
LLFVWKVSFEVKTGFSKINCSLLLTTLAQNGFGVSFNVSFEGQNNFEQNLMHSHALYYCSKLTWCEFECEY